MKLCRKHKTLWVSILTFLEWTLFSSILSKCKFFLSFVRWTLIIIFIFRSKHESKNSLFGQAKKSRRNRWVKYLIFNGFEIRLFYRTLNNEIFRTRYETSATMLESIQSNDERFWWSVFFIRFKFDQVFWFHVTK